MWNFQVVHQWHVTSFSYQNFKCEQQTQPITELQVNRLVLMLCEYN